MSFLKLNEARILYIAGFYSIFCDECLLPVFVLIYVSINLYIFCKVYKKRKLGEKI